MTVPWQSIHPHAVLQKFERVLHVVTDAIACFNETGKITWVNAVFAQLTQKPVAELLEADLLQVLPLTQENQPVSPSAHPVTIALQAKASGAQSYEFHQGENWLSLEVSWFHLQTNEQEAIAFLAIHDQSKQKRISAEVEQYRRQRALLEQLVEERTNRLMRINRQLQHESHNRCQAEEALRQSEQRFRNLVEQTHDWVWEINCNAVFTYTNPRVRNIVGYDPQSLLGKPIFDLMTTDEAKRFTTILSFAIAHREPFTNFEKQMSHRDGRLLILETNGSPMIDAQGKLQGYRGITRDITERKQIEQQTRIALAKERELSELKSRFITTASHEFRTPLAVIASSTGILENFSCKLNEHEKQKHLKRIQASIKHMVQLLEDVLVINQSEMGILKLNLGSLDLEQFCRDTVQEVQQNVPGCQILFSSRREAHPLSDVPPSGDIAAQPIVGLFDQKLLQLSLTHLLSNAVKFSGQRPIVYFDLVYSAEKVVLQIRDEGIGVPPEDQPHLFEPFHRGSNVGTIPGTGIGLSIVKSCMELHGGVVQLVSKLNVGTTVQIILPVTITNLSKATYGRS